MPGLIYRRYSLAVLTSVLTLNFVDRGLMSLLLQPIKVDLQLSDTQLGFLTGIAFGLFYATLGLPIARWADRGNRVSIAAIAIGLWGATVMSCVFVRSFAQLLCARIAAAVGEAGCMPPTYSLVGDYFPGPAERTRAIAIYWLGNPLASLISFAAGGWLSQVYGWRGTFFLLGVPGLLLAILVKLTLVDPRAPKAASSLEPGRQLPPLTRVLAVLWHQPSSRHLTLAFVLISTMALGMASWYGAFLIRSHGMNTSEVGLWLGLGFGVLGVPGTLLGGYVAARWFGGNERGQMRITALTIAMLTPCFALFLLLHQKYLALMALLPLVVVFNFFIGPTFALLQRLVADDMRATTLSVVMLLANLIGLGLGPQIVGVLSDLLSPTFHEQSLRFAMLCLSCVALWAAYHFWQAGRTVKADLASVRSGTISSVGQSDRVEAHV